jgi:hypothetical protein
MNRQRFIAVRHYDGRTWNVIERRGDDVEWRVQTGILTRRAARKAATKLEREWTARTDTAKLENEP